MEIRFNKDSTDKTNQRKHCNKAFVRHDVIILQRKILYYAFRILKTYYTISVSGKYNSISNLLETFKLLEVYNDIFIKYEKSPLISQSSSRRMNFAFH